MNDKALYWTSMVLGGLALVLLVANVSLINGNRNLQADLANRQAEINGGANWSQLNQALVQALAQASVEDDDRDIKDLLNSQGITVKPKAAADKTDKKK